VGRQGRHKLDQRKRSLTRRHSLVAAFATQPGQAHLQKPVTDLGTSYEGRVQSSNGIHRLSGTHQMQDVHDDPGGAS